MKASNLLMENTRNIVKTPPENPTLFMSIADTVREITFNS